MPSSFAVALVRAAYDAQLASDRSGNAAVAVSFLLHGVQLPTGFLVAAAQTLHAVEDEYVVAEDLDEDTGWQVWEVVPWGPWSGLLEEFDTDDERDALGQFLAIDPIYALLDQLARDGDAGRAVFSDPDQATYLFRQRMIRYDGTRRLVAAATNAAAGPDVVAGADPTLLADATAVASAFVNEFGAIHHARSPRAQRGGGVGRGRHAARQAHARRAHDADDRRRRRGHDRDGRRAVRARAVR